MIQVKSEVGVLKRVLLHRPSKELEQLTPDALESLLFDDIPYLHRAQQEHNSFAQILRDNGVEVVYLEELATETLDVDATLREQFVAELLGCSGSMLPSLHGALKEYLLGLWDTRTLVRKAMTGVYFNEIPDHTEGSLVQFVREDRRFALTPMPNLYFTRDPFAVIGNGAALSRMYYEARRRETLFGKYILSYHPDYARTVPFYYDMVERFSLEGGDILNLSEKVLAVGISQRTAPEGIDRLSHRLFYEKESSIETILALYIPGRRAFMHLDTVFTQVDRDKFLIHPEILKSLRIFEIKRGARRENSIRELQESLENVLCRYLQIDRCELIPCGGGDHITSQREQWNDGSNALCIAPGVVVMYDRNYVTNEILQSRGIHVVSIPSAELSRGRGGPRCMSMPLWREA